MSPTLAKPAMPGALTSLLEALADDLDRHRASPAIVTAINARLGDLQPGRFVEIDRQIREAGRLHHYRHPPRSLKASFLQRLNGHGRARPGADLELLIRDDRLATIFLSHADGRVREAALDRLQVGANSYLICALALRLNDWVGPVRYAAMDCAERTLPTASAATLAGAAWALLPRRASWSRGGDALIVLDTALARPEVIAEIVGQAIAQPTGPGMRLIAQLARHSPLDHFLPEVARDALQPDLRALAVRFMIDGFVSWPEGFDHVQSDKAFGEKRRVRRYSQRPLTVAVDVAAVIAAAARDRSPIVRAAAADGLVRKRNVLSDAKVLARLLAADAHAGVRQRAEFVLAELGED
jgi:hypothetical protein